MSALSLLETARDALGSGGGAFEAGELVVIQQGENRHLSTSLFVRWTGPGAAS
jgi:hypothetical protein